MRQKLHRGKRPVFRKRNPALRIIGTAVAVLAIVAGGFFGAKFLTEHPPASSAPDTQEQPTVTTTTAATTTTTQPAEETPSVISRVRGFYLPFSALSDDNLSATLTAAKQAGFNSVVFDLKDVEGNLYYRFSSDTAIKVNTFTQDALTEEQLTALFALIRDAGLVPVPRLHAFRDNLGAKALPEARIAYKDNPSWSWFDGKDSATSNRWLSPYDNDAHDYIGSLAEELKSLGAGAVMLDSVQFPNPSLTQRASFGTDNATLKWDEVLALFVSKMKTRLGEDCPVILTCTGESALGTATQIYGGNPLTFAPTMAAPVLSSDKVQESVEAMILRTKVMAEADKPTLSPVLETEGLSAAQVKQMIADCTAGGADSFILYHPTGTYDFDAY